MGDLRVRQQVRDLKVGQKVRNLKIGQQVGDLPVRHPVRTLKVGQQLGGLQVGHQPGGREWWLSSTGPIHTRAPRFEALQTRASDARSTNCSYGGSHFWNKYPNAITVEVCPLPVSVHGQDAWGGLGHALAINESVISAHATAVSVHVCVCVCVFVFVCVCL